MAQITENRKKIESAFMQAYWKFRKEYGDPEDNEAYWISFCEAADEIGKQFGFDPYIVSVIVCCAEDLDRQAHERFGYQRMPGDGDLSLKVFNHLRRKRGLPMVAVVKG